MFNHHLYPHDAPYDAPYASFLLMTETLLSVVGSLWRACLLCHTYILNSVQTECDRAVIMLLTNIELFMDLFEVRRENLFAGRARNKMPETRFVTPHFSSTAIATELSPHISIAVIKIN
jgi:hypothetical protein